MIFDIAKKDIKISVLRDKKNLILTLVMPLILILIIGSALSTMFNPDKLVNSFTIGVVNEDDGILSKVLINQVLRENLSDICETFVVSKENADKMLKEKNVVSIIYIPKNFSNNIDKNLKTDIDIKSQIDDSFESMIIESVIKGFTENISTIYASTYAIDDTLEKNNIIFDMDKNNYMNQMQEQLSGDSIRFKTFEQEKEKEMTAMQYYSAAMIAMFILFNALNGSRGIIEERENKTLDRLMTTLKSKYIFILGKTIGLFVICLIQVSIMIFFTWIFYGVYWGESITGIIVMTILTAMVGSSFGIMIASLSVESKVVEVIGSTFIWLSSMLGGVMMPIDVMPDFIGKVSKFVVNYWISKGYMELMSGNNIIYIMPVIGVLFAVSIIFTSIGVLKLKV